MGQNPRQLSLAPGGTAAGPSAAGHPDDVARAIAQRPALETEQLVVQAGGVAAAVRSPDEWLAHPQGRAMASEPLAGRARLGDAPPRGRRLGPLPAAGVRIVDLTRVIAGPVATRFLGALGADVLRLDPPRRPDMMPGSPADTLLGKRSVLTDLTAPGDLAALHGLLDDADVVVCGYRPGALDRFGLRAEDLAERHAGLVAVYLSAWGHSGPWSARRGFDSIVQAACGIAAAESADGSEPGVLPGQLLDHGTGYLAAAAVLDGLRRQGEHGGTQIRRLSLAATARWLVVAGPASRPRPYPRPWLRPRHRQHPPAPGPADQWSTALASAAGPVEAIAPPGRLGGRELRWPATAACYGAAQPHWLARQPAG